MMLSTDLLPNFFSRDNQAQLPYTFFACDEVGRGPLAGPVTACCVRVDCTNLQALVEKEKTLIEMGVKDSKKVSEKKRKTLIESFQDSSLLPPLTKDVDVRDGTNELSISIAFCHLSPFLIDQVNILQSSFIAMRWSLLSTFSIATPFQSSFALIDGNKPLPTFLQGHREEDLFTKNNQELFQYKTHQRWEKEFPFYHAAHQHHLFNLHGIPFQRYMTHLNQLPIIKGDAKSVWIAMASLVAKEARDSWMKDSEQEFPGFSFAKHVGYPTAKHYEELNTSGKTSLHRNSFRLFKAL